MASSTITQAAATHPTFTQANRLLSLRSTLPEDLLLPVAFAASEATSALFHFNLEMISPLENGAYLAQQDLLGTKLCFAACIDSDYASGPRRFFNGIVSKVSQKDNDDHFCYLNVQLVPWLWLLDLDSACRIFQGKSIPEIVETILDEYRKRFPGFFFYYM